jgi:hypothetical protein
MPVIGNGPDHDGPFKPATLDTAQHMLDPKLFIFGFFWELCGRGRGRKR